MRDCGSHLKRLLSSSRLASSEASGSLASNSTGTLLEWTFLGRQPTAIWPFGTYGEDQPAHAPFEAKLVVVGVLVPICPGSFLSSFRSSRRTTGLGQIPGQRRKVLSLLVWQSCRLGILGARMQAVRSLRNTRTTIHHRSVATKEYKQQSLPMRRRA